MPTYEYRCRYCHELTEAFQRMSDAPLTHCPHCQKEGLDRIVSGGAGVIYKGEGWYVTDYSKKSSGGKEPASTTSTVTKKETKGDSSASTTESKSGAAPKSETSENKPASNPASSVPAKPSGSTSTD